MATHIRLWWTIWVLFSSLLTTVRSQFSSSTYNDAYGREVFMRLYYQISATPDQCLIANYPTWTPFRTIRANGAICYGDSHCHIAVNIAEKKIQVSFRGSTDFNLYQKSAMAAILSDNSQQTWEGSQSLGKIASGHNETWGYIWPPLRTAMFDLWAQYCDFKLIIAGHSIGSCLAQALAIQMWNQGLWSETQMELYNYGSPRCGDVDFSIFVRRAVQERYNIVTGSDITVNNPTNINIFSCPASATYNTVPSKKTCWRHSSYPVKYVNNAITKRCSHEEDSNCGGGFSFPDGYSVFNTAKENYGTLIC